MKNKAEIMKVLKELTVAEKASFAEAMNYFFDHIAENVSLRNDGELLKENSEFYKELLKPVAQYFGKDVRVYLIFLVKMNDAEFIHGTASLSNGYNIALYFFRDISVGIAVATSFTTPHCDFFRLSVKRIPYAFTSVN
jgi:hypothetical protein